MSSETYISILRGINVGGNHRMPMAELKTLLTAQGLEGLRTYIQSGNLVFNYAPQQAAALSAMIGACLENAYGFKVPTLTFTASEWKAIVNAQPFGDAPPKELQVTLLNAPAPEGLTERILEKAAPGELAHAAGRAIYFHFPNGYGRTKLTNAFIEKQAGTTASTRNWKTTCKLLELALA